MLQDFGLDYYNPIIKPIRKLKVYFYNKAIKRVPKYEAEKAIWYGDIIFYPIYYFTNKADFIYGGELINYYGYEFTKNLLDDIYDNLYLLANYKLRDYSNKNSRVKKDFISILYGLFSVYYEIIFYKSVIDKKKIEKLKEIYYLVKQIENNPTYKDDIQKYLENDEDYYISIHMRNYNLLFRILSRYIKLDKSYSCSIHYDMVYDYFDSKQKVDDLLIKYQEGYINKDKNVMKAKKNLSKILLNSNDIDYYKKLMISYNNKLIQEIRTIMKRCVSSKKLLKNRSF